MGSVAPAGTVPEEAVGVGVMNPKVENHPVYHQVVGLLEDLDKLEMSNKILVAELGRVATALGVEPNMQAVLGKIAELQRPERYTLAQWARDQDDKEILKKVLEKATELESHRLNKGNE